MKAVAPGGSALARRQALSAFLRAKRKRIAPGELGLPTSPLRRAKGLLREEVAQLAGIGVAWYTWLEQARPVNVSLPVLERVARALRMDAAERDHLMHLARPDLAPRPVTSPTPPVPEALLQVMHGMAPHPVYMVNARSDVLAWNTPAAQLFGDFAHLDPSERNIMWLLFCEPAWRDLLEDWETIAESAADQFRASIAAIYGDAATLALVERLRAGSAVFARCWDTQEVERPPIRRKVLRHPQAGRMEFDYATFAPQGTEDGLRVTVYTAADKASTKRLGKLLKTTG